MNLLSIGGTDPSSGAGIQSDIKTFASFNVHGCTVITAITGQNTSTFDRIQPVSQKMLKSQLDSVFNDFKIDAIKIGMVYNSEIIKTIYNKLKKIKVQIILDPVIKSTTGGILIEKSAIKDFKKFLIPLSTIITPNKFEAEFLSKIKINSKISLHQAAQKIQNMGVKNVVITGIESEKNEVNDFVLEGGKKYWIKGKKIPSENHGSGCNYSSAITFALASKNELKESVKFAKEFSSNSIKNAKKLGKGIVITQIKKNDQVFNELTIGINKFIEIKNIHMQIPECQTNFVFSQKEPKSIKQVLGIEGRIVKTGKTVTVAGNLSYGGSKHVATAMLTVNKKFSKICSAINLKYQDSTIKKLKKSKFIISSYDRKKESKIVKNKEDSSIKWGVNSAIKNLKNPPDVIFHKGDFGKEPMIIFFAETPSALIKKISKIFN